MPSPARATNLTCEYLTNPIGIGTPRPRLAWHMTDDRRGARQTAYQIVAGPSDTKFDAWDSGKVSTDQSLHIEFGGGAMQSMQRIYWRVKLWDADGQPTDWSEPAFFEAGLLQRDDWKGDWIGSTVVGGPRTMAPCPYLRKSFVHARSITRARLYVTALGLYEFYINGQRVSDAVFTPGRTEYAHRVPYQVFDVTTLLRDGDNALGAILGDGWYCGHVHNDPRQYYGDRPRLLAQLRIDTADGTSTTIATDSTWRTATGPLRSSDLLMGEDYDARLDLGAWATAGYDDSKWQAAETFADPGIAIVAQQMPLVRPVQEIRPIAPPRKLTRKRWIFDLGQNMVGRVRVKLTGKRGTTISIRHAEMLDKDGMLYTQALRSARATDYYTKATDDEESYEPHFTFHGFRYVEIKGIDGEASADTVTGVVLHTDLSETGTFECSDPMINQLQSNIRWSQKGNFLEIPTDCPQRDERLGWTGDAQVFIRTAAFNMNVAPFFTKWLQDMEDAQFESGGIPSTVPYCPSIPNEGGPAWSDAVIICPWTIYLCYGDTRILANRYAMMGKFIEFLKATSPGHIRASSANKWRGYGDWLSHNADTPPDLIGTAYFAHCARLISKIAAVLNESSDAAMYASLADEIKSAWRKAYVADGHITCKTQTANLLGLQFDLLESAHRPAAVAALIEDIQSRGTHLSTGFVGTPLLTHALTAAGRTDLAFDLLLQKTFPSWLFPVTHGATTMWERWDGWTPEKGFNDVGMNSYNHYAYGAVGEWMYSTIAGIDLDPQQPGYKHIVLHPTPNERITSAKASLRSPYGLIKSEWSLKDRRFDLSVTVPPNTTATLHLLAKEVLVAAVGAHLINHTHGIATLELPSGTFKFATIV